MSETIKTLIELYDPSTHLYNALGVMLFRPEKVIFLIPEHSSKIYNKFKTEYKQLWQSRGCMPEHIVSVLTKTSDITVLAETIRSFCTEDTVLDIEGGTPELYLAAGTVFASPPDGTHCLRVDFKDEKIYEFRLGEATSVRSFTDEERARISLSVDDCIRMYGGEITHDSYTSLRTKGMTKGDIIREARLIYRTVEKAVGRSWNDIVPERVHIADQYAMTVSIHSDDLRRRDVSSVVDALLSAKLIEKVRVSGQRHIYKCTSPLVYSCFLKSGEALELYTLSLALEIDGVTDARCGVCVSFYGSEGSSDNELDCIFMRDTTPVFISCKNGKVSSDELYKFHTVSRQFGGNEHISLLVAPHFYDATEKSANIRDRAELYRIAMLTDFDEKTDEESVDYLRKKTDERKKKLSSPSGR